MNNDIQETKCSFEVSKLLRQKGFAQRTQSFFFEDEEFRESNSSEYRTDDYGFQFTTNDDLPENWNDDFLTNKNGGRCFGCSKSRGYFETYSSPTHTIAIEWIRVNFGIWISIELTDNTRAFGYFPCITTMKDRDYNDEDMIDQAKYYYLTELRGKTPQEAIEAALIYALTKLI